jgi:sugar phosphate isomerase/epimerase
MFGVISCKNKAMPENYHKKSHDSEIRLSLAQWSFHKSLLSKEISHLEFIDKAAQLGFEGVEYVSTFFKDKVKDTLFLDSMNHLASQHNLRQILIMVDIEKDLANPVEHEREQAVEEHYKWIDAAKYLVCHAIRVNLFGNGTPEEISFAAVKSLRQLCDYAAPKDIWILVENHGGLSSDGTWLVNTIQRTESTHCGTLPDFDNFCLRRVNGARWGAPCEEEYDRYKGVAELLPFAKALSAKSYDFDEEGFETTIDYPKMMSIVKESGYTGYIGVEFEGDRLSEEEGILATKLLLARCLQKNL